MTINICQPFKAIVTLQSENGGQLCEIEDVYFGEQEDILEFILKYQLYVENISFRDESFNSYMFNGRFDVVSIHSFNVDDHMRLTQVSPISKVQSISNYTRVYLTDERGNTLSEDEQSRLILEYGRVLTEYVIKSFKHQDITLHATLTRNGKRSFAVEQR